MRLLDLFCGAGGAAMGYSRVGFDEIVGVDNRPQRNYPFTFVLGDALEYLRKYGGEFDFIHASPPCQAFSALKTMPNAREHPNLVEPTRELLIEIGKPWVIENVPGAPLRNPITLCGSSFRLGLDNARAELRRHRLFETSFDILLVPPCQHGWSADSKVVGVCGGHGRDRRRVRSVNVYGHAGGKSNRDGTQQFSTDERKQAMGIDWMTGNELSQAIPPAYTEWIGRQFLLQEGLE